MLNIAFLAHPLPSLTPYIISRSRTQYSCFPSQSRGSTPSADTMSPSASRSSPTLSSTYRAWSMLPYSLPPAASSLTPRLSRFSSRGSVSACPLRRPSVSPPSYSPRIPGIRSRAPILPRSPPLKTTWTAAPARVLMLTQLQRKLCRASEGRSWHGRSRPRRRTLCRQ